MRGLRGTTVKWIMKVFSKCMDLNNDLRCDISEHNWSTFELSWVLIWVTASAATSITLSARSASSSKDWEPPVEGKTILTSGGNLCKNNACRKAVSAVAALSPRSSCILLSSWDGFLSPSSSVLKSCYKRRCSDAIVLAISWVIRLL